MPIDINNPSGAFGVTDLEQQLLAATEPFVASTDVTAKAVVAIGTDGRIAGAGTGTTAGLVIGVAAKAVSSGNIAKVVVRGVVTGVTAQGAVAAGDIVKRSGTTAGAVAATASPATGEALGVAIAASSGGTVTIYVQPGR